MTEFKLCYAEGCWAYFTTCPLDKQWGDDWNDAPYEHNAGNPYMWYPYMQEKSGIAPYEIKQIAFYASLVTPDYGHLNSPYSVEMINAGAVPWLRSESWERIQVAIMAGIQLDQFIELVRSIGGSVYMEVTP